MKKLPLVLAALMIVTLCLSCLATVVSAKVEAKQPADGERTLYTDNRTNGFAQFPHITDNGNGDIEG